MSVRILLQRQHSHYTNLDIVEGRVILNLNSNEKIAAVVVKLEGESKTRLSGQRDPQNDPHSTRTELEFHKILYKVAELFPSKELKTQYRNAPGYGLVAGQHEWPFSFKLPFNNDCLATERAYANVSFLGGIRVQLSDPQTRHMKKTLPPSMNGFPGEAEIKYYIKATVQRPAFYKENYRFVQNLNFLPIEPIRPPETKLETFARRQHQFTAGLAQQRKNSIFTLKRTPSEPAPEEPPRFKIDARLPSPAILTCNEPIPLRVIITKLSETTEQMFLLQFQVVLISTTHVRAHDLVREEKGSWVITSRSQLNMPLGTREDAAGTEILLPAHLWNTKALPNTVAPSFDTCNISKTYEVEVRVGLSYGSPGKIQPQTVVLPLRIPVQIYSGISPPPALLERMQSPSSANVTPQQEPTSFIPPDPSIPPTPHTPTYAQFNSSFPAAASTTAAGPSTNTNPLYPPQLPPGQAGQATAAWDAPPSYEDAIAGDIGPVDGPRRDYTDMSANADGGQTSKDDRLFPESAGGTGSNRSSWAGHERGVGPPGSEQHRAESG